MTELTCPSELQVLFQLDRNLTLYLGICGIGARLTSLIPHVSRYIISAHIRRTPSSFNRNIETSSELSYWFMHTACSDIAVEGPAYQRFNPYRPNLGTFRYEIVLRRAYHLYTTLQNLTSVRPATSAMESVQEHASLKRSEEVWFDDGNIVLQAGDTAFKMYRGILSRESPFFRDMFSLPQSDATMADCYEGCFLITVHDKPDEMKKFLAATHNYE